MQEARGHRRRVQLQLLKLRVEGEQEYGGKCDRTIHVVDRAVQHRRETPAIRRLGKE